MRLTILFLCGVEILLGQSFSAQEIQRWEAQAKQIEIIRDNWGIPHIYGKTDADAVFGMLYAQCEDDFARLERNYLDATGQMAAAFGEQYLYQDLRARMFLDSLEAKVHFEASPEWLKKLCYAFADGINYYLYTHPDVKPDLITKFQPWMPFTFSEGSIGGDITSISLQGIEAFYANDKTSFIDTRRPLEEAPTGSNGFAVAPSKSLSGNALFLINPHTSFYFRSELHVNSEEGLKAYGASTWGQFFIYQGFNEYCGWMHTSSKADVIDDYQETVEQRNNKYFYKYGNEWRPVTEKKVVLSFKTATGLKEKAFTTYRTHHGPIIRSEGDKWIAVSLMERPLDALQQSYLRTKSKGYKDFKKTMNIRTNSSNNTVFADSKGNIAYWHGNFMPKRNPAYDYNGLIDGSNPMTDWNGLHKTREMIHVKNPATGWIQNCNATPFTVSGSASPKKEDFPVYMAPDLENFRGINAVRVLSREQKFTLDKLVAAANDPYLAAFKKLIPDLVKAYNESGNRSDTELREAIEMLKSWNMEYGEASIPTTLAIVWGETMLSVLQSVDFNKRKPFELFDDQIISLISSEDKVKALKTAMQEIQSDFGTWKKPWGEINRFQRLTGKIEETYNDDLPSIPVGFTSSTWGSLAAFRTSNHSNTNKRYGISGNSFVAVVEFGKKLVARTVVSGGQGSVPGTRHFVDQAEMFCKGAFKTAYYYKEDVLKNKEKQYHPGQK